MRLVPLKTMLGGIVIGLAISTSAADRRVPADYPTIQAAVDAAASGDTIHIAQGVYTEQVAIRKNLTLQGQPGTILRAIPDMEDLGFGWRNLVLIHGPSNVTLSGLMFEGDQLADQQPIDPDNGVRYGTRAVYYVDAGGRVENCQFIGFREKTTGQDRDVAALAVYNDLSGAPLLGLEVVGNSFIDCYDGIKLRGASDKTSLDVWIQGNTIRGVGPTDAVPPDGVLTGIQILQGVTGTVIGNQISGYSYDGDPSPFPFFLGILATGGSFPDFVPLDPVRFESNEFQDNDIHLLLVKADQHEILNNRFEGSGVGQRKSGIEFSGTNVVVNGNYFRDIPNGIVAYGDDPVLGEVVGAALNAQIKDNRFRDVETPIEVQTQATASEEGTLIAPFPDPELDIAKAVRLSWPGYYEDAYILEGARTLGGPWTSIDAMLSIEDGSVITYMPAEEAYQFYRLRKS